MGITRKNAIVGRKRFLLRVTYFPMNLVYPFTIRVTGIKIVLTSSWYTSNGYNYNRQKEAFPTDKVYMFLYIYFMGSETLPSAYYILSD